MDLSTNSCFASSEKPCHSSIASTRANSPVGSSAASDDAESSASPCLQTSAFAEHANVEKLGVLGLRRGIRTAILKDLGVEMISEEAMATPSTAIGSPSPSLYGRTPPTPSSVFCASPSGITSTSPLLLSAGTSGSVPSTPVIGDASQRIGNLATNGNASQMKLAFGDSSLRSPTVTSTPLQDASRCSPLLSSPGLPPVPKSVDASSRTPPPKSFHPLTRGRSVLGDLARTPLQGDASQRSPVAKSYVVAAGSWKAASATIAATRDAAEAGAISRAKAIDDHAIIASGPQSSSSKSEEMGSVGLHVADSLKCWLSGSSANKLPSAQELEARLRAAQPDCYDD